jgi:hypothetical protein
MNTTKRGRRKKKLAIEKIILRNKRTKYFFFTFTGDVSPKEKIVIHISNIGTFNIIFF